MKSELPDWNEGRIRLRQLSERASASPEPRVLIEALELCGNLTQLQLAGRKAVAIEVSEESAESLRARAELVDRHLSARAVSLPADAAALLRNLADEIAGKLLGAELESATTERLRSMCAEARNADERLKALHDREEYLVRYQFILETMKQLLGTLQRPNAAGETG